MSKQLRLAKNNDNRARSVRPEHVSIVTERPAWVRNLAADRRYGRAA
jgi:hypothetical protein